jgi:hypothetical protein
MKKSEMVKILTMVSALDGRSSDDMQVEMWMRLFDGCSFESVEAAIIPAYKESDKGFLTAKQVWDVMRREASQPKPNQWVKDLHQIGEHFACTAEDCARWDDEAKALTE